MNREQELELVKSAFFLEDEIINLRNEKDLIERFSVPQKPIYPQEPQKRIVHINQIPYPTISSTVKWGDFWKRGLIVAGIGFLLMIMSTVLNSVLLGTFGILAIFPSSIIVLLIDGINAYKRKKQVEAEQIENISHSEDYQRQCMQIDEQNRQLQAQADNKEQENYSQRYEEYKESCQKYELDIKHYTGVAVPEWEKEVSIVKTALYDAERALKEIYDKNIIPAPYRNYNALLYLSVFMGTSSDYTLKETTDKYDVYVLQIRQQQQIDIAKAQQQVAEEMLREQQYGSYLQEQTNSILEDGNDTLKSISSWQQTDFALREFRRAKARREAKKLRKSM